MLLVQKRELERRLSEKYVARDARLKGLESDLVKVILGPRRAGKSFFALHALSGRKFGYANFDDERLVGEKDYDKILEAINSVYGNPTTLFFDEVQNLDKWELFVNRLQRQGYNLVVTGSNAHLLARELATHLTGRHAPTIIFPFSFREYLSLEQKTLTEAEKTRKLREYAQNGGYPEPLLKNLDAKEYLSTLFQSTIYKDIVKRHKIRGPQALEDLAQYAISNTATEYSYNTLAKATRCKSVHTAQKYARFLEEAFLTFTMPRFSYKTSKQPEFNKKTYCIDNGLIAAIAQKNSPDWGKAFENLAAIELKRRELEGMEKAHYWKSQQGEEVDFALKKQAKITALIQVCFDPSNPKTKQRETRALIKASKELSCKNLLILTDDFEATEHATWQGQTAKIKYLPLAKWLSNPKT